MFKNNRIYLLILLFFIWPYDRAPLHLGYLPFSWRFAFAFLILMALAKMQWPTTWLKNLGLEISLRQTIYCVAAFFLSLVVFQVIIQNQLRVGGFFQIFRLPDPFLGKENIFKFSWLIVRIFQPLNEEIVLRALLLGFLGQFCSQKRFLSIYVALIFAGLHQVMYALSPFGLLTPLNINALIALFCFSWAANELYFRFGHIGYGVALHIAWNIWRFFGPIYRNGHELNEAETFNILEGSTPVMVLVALMCIICVASLWRTGRMHTFKAPL